MKIILFLVCLVSFVAAFGADLNQSDPGPQLKAYVDLNGFESAKPAATFINNVIVKIDLGCPLALPATWTDYSIAKMDKKDRKIVDGQWVAKTPQELTDDETAEETASLTNNPVFMAIIEAVNEDKGKGTISVTNVVGKVKGKKRKQS